MVKWRVLKRIKNHKRAVTNLMYIHNWMKAVQYVSMLKEKNNPSINDPLCHKDTFIKPWEESIRHRLEQMEAPEVFSIERKW